MKLRILASAIGFLTTAFACKSIEKSGTARVTPKDQVLMKAEVENDMPAIILNPVTKASLASAGVAPLPPEANGIYRLSCEDKNTSRLVETPSPIKLQLAEIPQNMNYAASIYLKIDGKNYTATVVLLPNANCRQTDARSLKTMEAEQVFFICNWATTYATECRVTKAIYTAMEASLATQLNRLHFCGFRDWMSNRTYDITDKKCQQAYTEAYGDGSSTRENKSITGNQKDSPLLAGKFSWDNVKSELTFVPAQNGQTITLIKTQDAQFFSTLDGLP